MCVCVCVHTRVQEREGERERDTTLKEMGYPFSPEGRPEPWSLRAQDGDIFCRLLSAAAERACFLAVTSRDAAELGSSQLVPERGRPGGGAVPVRCRVPLCACQRAGRASTPYTQVSPVVVPHRLPEGVLGLFAEPGLAAQFRAQRTGACPLPGAQGAGGVTGLRQPGGEPAGCAGAWLGFKGTLPRRGV